MFLESQRLDTETDASVTLPFHSLWSGSRTNKSLTDFRTVVNTEETESSRQEKHLKAPKKNMVEGAWTVQRLETILTAVGEDSVQIAIFDGLDLSPEDQPSRRFLEAICDALWSNNGCHHLSFRNCRLGDAGVALVMESVHRHGCLCCIDFSNNGISDAGCEIISDYLQEFPLLTRLILAENAIGDAGAFALYNVLMDDDYELDLSILDLTSNQIGTEEIRRLYQAQVGTTPLSVLFARGQRPPQGVDDHGWLLRQARIMEELLHLIDGYNDTQRRNVVTRLTGGGNGPFQPPNGFVDGHAQEQAHRRFDQMHMISCRVRLAMEGGGVFLDGRFVANNPNIGVGDDEIEGMARWCWQQYCHDVTDGFRTRMASTPNFDFFRARDTRHVSAYAHASSLNFVVQTGSEALLNTPGGEGMAERFQNDVEVKRAVMGIDAAPFLNPSISRPSPRPLLLQEGLPVGNTQNHAERFPQLFLIQDGVPFEGEVLDVLLRRERRPPGDRLRCLRGIASMLYQLHGEELQDRGIACMLEGYHWCISPRALWIHSDQQHTQVLDWSHAFVRSRNRDGEVTDAGSRRADLPQGRVRDALGLSTIMRQLSQGEMDLLRLADHVRDSRYENDVFRVAHESLRAMNL